MVDALGDLLEAGRLKLYCVPSFDRESWTRRDLPLEERARGTGTTSGGCSTRLVPFVQADSHTHELIATGASFGAYHAANFCLKRADLFPLAICMSGVYDVSVQGGGERGDAVYFNNPMDYVAHLNGDHLDWLRGQASLLLVCGQGQWEDTTGALESTRAFRRAARREGNPPRGGSVGLRRPARLAVMAAPDRASSAAVSLMTDRLIGLLLGTEEDWPAAFEALVGAPGARRRARAAHRADRQRAVRPALRGRATRSSSTGSRGGTTCRARG